MLADRPLAHLLAYAVDRKLAGTFELVDRSRGHMLIHVTQGLLSRVATSEPVSYLGHVLYEHGLVDQAALNTSLAEVARTKRLHGMVLVDAGLLTHDKLAEGLRLQRLRKLHYGFGFAPDATFAFYNGVDLVGARPHDVEPTAPFPSIWRGIVSNPSWAHVRGTLASVADRPVRLARSVDTAGLSSAELAAVETMRAGGARVADVAARATQAGQPGELLVYFLVITRFAQVDDGARTSSTPAPPIVTSVHGDASPESVRPPVSMSFRAPGSTRPKVRVSDEMRRLIDTLPDRVGTAPPPPVAAAPSTPPQSAAPSIPPASAAGQPNSVPPARQPSTAPLRRSSAPPPIPRSDTPPPMPRVDTPPPPGPRSRRVTEAEHTVAQAEMHLVIKDYDEALATALKALAQSPGMPAAVVLQAYLEALKTPEKDVKRLRELLRWCDGAIADLPTCRRGHFYRAEVKRRLGDHAGALADLAVAVKADPADADVRAEMHRQEKRVAEARRPSGLFGRPKQE